MPGPVGLDEDAADVAALAVGRIGGGGPAGQAAQRGAGGGEFGDAAFDLAKVGVDERGDVLAWRAAAIADGEDVADFGQGQPGGLGVTDETEPGAGLGRIIPLAASSVTLAHSPGRRGAAVRRKLADFIPGLVGTTGAYDRVVRRTVAYAVKGGR